MGGTNDPENLIRLTVEEHAQTHLALWMMYQKREDYIAYLALSKQINPSEASRQAWILGSYKGGYAKKPNKKPSPQKIEYYCVGCQKRVKPSILKSGKGHKKCFQKKFKLPETPNSGRLGSEDGKRMAEKNNASVECPHCHKRGQSRAMKRWHFDNCKHRH